MSDANSVLSQIKEQDVKFVDLRFSDPRGKWQHLAMDAAVVDEDMFTDGIMFDGSSIAGWKAINESDMTLMPDPATAVMDPFSAQASMILFCDVLEPSTHEAYGRCPRSTSRRAEAYLLSSGAGDTAFFGPEAEFFIFDDVRYDVSMHNTFFKIDDTEGPTIRAPSSRAATPVIARRSRAAISRFRRSIPAPTSAPRCCR